MKTRPPGRVTRSISSAIRHGSGDVLEHVGGVADVHRRVAERQLHAAADDGAGTSIDPVPDELADVGVEGEVRRPAASNACRK